MTDAAMNGVEGYDHGVFSAEDLNYEDNDPSNQNEADFTVDENNHVIVKSEIIEFEETDQDSQENGEYDIGYIQNDGNGCEEPIFQYDDGSEGGAYVRQMVTGTPEQREERLKARRENMIQRPDCPVCGDRVNGIHYGIYTCEGCKNFFKRTMSIKRPYTCGNRGRCDVGVFVDVTGIKRKGTRCQACRFLGCLDAGMIHQGHNRSTGRPRRTQKLDSPKPKRQKTSNHLSYSESNTSMSFNDSLSESYSIPEEKSILESMLEAPSIEYKGDEFKSVPVTPTTAEASKSKFVQSEEMEANKAQEELNNINLVLLRDQLQYERKKNSEMERQLKKKEEQVKSLEMHLSLMEKHMAISQSMMRDQRTEIVKLKSEIKGLGLFQRLVKKSKNSESRSNGENYQDQNSLTNGNHDPLQQHGDLHQELNIKEEPDN